MKKKRGRPSYKSVNEACIYKQQVLISLDDMQLVNRLKEKMNIESTSELFRNLLRRAI